MDTLIGVLVYYVTKLNSYSVLMLCASGYSYSTGSHCKRTDSAKRLARTLAKRYSNHGRPLPVFFVR